MRNKKSWLKVYALVFVLLFLATCAFKVNQNNCVRDLNGNPAKYLFVKGC